MKVEPSPVAEPAAVQQPSRFYLPELDALRFFAFFSVFSGHLMLAADEAGHSIRDVRLRLFLENCGPFGVDLFFLISAYLLTELLVREKRNYGTVHVQAFYLRRILRIWPLYFSFLGAYLVLSLGFPDLRIPWLRFAAFLFLAGNFVSFLNLGTNFVFTPLWSLSVEEQFYALWPLIMRRIDPTRLLYVGIAIWIFSTLARFCLVLQDMTAGQIWFSGFARMDSFAAGVILAAVLNGRTRHGFENHRRLLAAVGLMGWALAGACSLHGSHVHPIGSMLGYPIVALGSSAFFLSVLGVSSDSRMPTLRSWIIYLGRISYGLYMFHPAAIFIVTSALRGAAPLVYWPCNAIGSLAITILLSILSYRFLETPFLKLKTKFEYVRSAEVAIHVAAV